MAETPKVIILQDVSTNDHGGREYEAVAAFIVPLEVELKPYWDRYKRLCRENADVASFATHLVAWGFQAISTESFDMEWN